MNYKIKLGKTIWVRFIGYFLVFIGLLSFLLFLILWISGNKLPNEMFFVYYAFIVGNTMWSSGLISIILITLGIKISEIRIYKNAQLNFDNNGGLKIMSENEQIQLKKWQIGQIKIRKKWLSKLLNFHIKTTIKKEYKIKADRSLLEKLNEEYKYKLNMKNAV